MIDYLKSINAVHIKVYKQDTQPPLRFTVPLFDFLSKNEQYIYRDTKDIPFEKLLPEFQEIMKSEFLS